MLESELLAKFIAEAPLCLPVRVFRRNIVNGTVSAGGKHFHAKAGIRGQADAYALARGGRHVEIETKAAKGVMLVEQERWRAFCIGFGIPHLVLKALRDEHPDATVGRWIAELARAIQEDRKAAGCSL